MELDTNTVLLALVVVQLQRLIPLMRRLIATGTTNASALSRLLKHFGLEDTAAPAKASAK